MVEDVEKYIERIVCGGEREGEFNWAMNSNGRWIRKGRR